MELDYFYDSRCVLITYSVRTLLLQIQSAFQSLLVLSTSLLSSITLLILNDLINQIAMVRIGFKTPLQATMSYC